MICAYVEGGGKQHRVCIGDHLQVEKVEVATGDTVQLDKVLAIIEEDGKTHFGTPYLDGSQVTASVIGHGKGKKIRILKLRRRKNSRRRQGHRQCFTELKIMSIALPGTQTKPVAAEKTAKEA